MTGNFFFLIAAPNFILHFFFVISWYIENVCVYRMLQTTVRRLRTVLFRFPVSIPLITDTYLVHSLIIRCSNHFLLFTSSSSFSN